MTTSPTTSSAVASRLYAALGGARTARRNRTLSAESRTMFLLMEAVRLVRHSDAEALVEIGVPASVQHAAYGIAWSLETGRLSGVQHVAIRSLSLRELCALVAEVAEATTCIADVPYYLHSRETAA